MVCKFFSLTRRKLQERLDMILAGLMPVEMMLRKFWYFCRNAFLKENKHLDEIDSKAKKPYENWTGTILPKWLLDHAAGPLGIDLQYPPGVVYEKSMDINSKKDCEWWRIRTALNLFAKPSATCIGAGRPFLIDKNTRGDVTRDRSLILICEKATVIDKLLARLVGEGYHINVIGTAGCSPSEVLEAVIEVAAEMVDKRINFWVLHLHDYDVSGLEIFFKLRQWGKECVIDVGVNREFVDYLKAHKKLDMRLIEEHVLVTNYKEKLRRWIAQGDSVYSEEDFRYLQGEPFETKNKKGKLVTHYRATRIEIDLIVIEYGIDVFVNFILETIADKCRVWDLSRIGVSDFELEEPVDLYEEAVHKWTQPIRETYKSVYDHISQPELRVLGIVKDVLSTQMKDLNDRFQRILDEHWKHAHTVGYGIGFGELNRLKGLDGLKGDFSDVWNIEWITREDYVGDLAKVNAQIEFYEGDVREGRANLQKQVDIIQKRIHDDQQEEYDDSDFEDQLEEIDWGSRELDAIEPPDEREMLRQVITACQTRIEEIDNK